MKDIAKLADQELLKKTRDLVSQERQITTTVLHHLREVERRRLFSDLGYPSLFEYAVNDLKYSESSAHRRISAMRLLKELPELEEKIESGSLSLSVIADAQRLFRQEAKVEKPLAVSEKREFLKSLEGKSKREAEKVILARSTVPEAIRPESVRSVSETHAELRFVATQDTLEKLERIRGLLGHVYSEMSLAELVEAMAKITLEKLDPAAKGKGPKVEQPSNEAKELVAPAQPTEKGGDLSRYIKATLKREVWRRANGRCQLCRGFYRLQIDHVRPIAMGGSSQIENLRLLCFHCNQRQADLKIGRQKMERKRNCSPVLSLAGGAAAQTRPR